MQIIDSHMHLGEWPFPMPTVSADQMVVHMKRQGIGRAIVSSVLGITHYPRQGNRELAAQIADRAELFGYVAASVNHYAESREELDHHLKNPKFVGVKIEIHPIYCLQKLSSYDGQALMRIIADYGRPVLVHTHTSPLESPWNVVPVAKAHSHLPIIMAHMGGDAWWDGIAAAREADNIYLDPCGTCIDSDKIGIAVHELGAERLLFGSDYTLFDPAYTLGMIEDADLSNEQRDLILHGNAQRVFGLPPAG
jgi:predicted TIM-barrel fold metal-dependent hydrolase